MVVLGFVLAVWIAWVRARRAGADPAAITSIAVIGAIAGLVGCRAMHLIHYFGDPSRAGDMDAREMATMTGGGEILGGVLLAVATVILYLLITRKSIRLYLDIVFPSMILAMGIGRIGCLLAGCCWGQTCLTDTGAKALPWAIRFPYGAPAYAHQWQQGQLTVPDELLWVLPGAKKRTPIPPEILADQTIDGHEPLARYAEHVLALAGLKDTAPNSPEAAQHRQQVQALEPALPGRSKQQKADYIAAAVHLSRLSQHQDRPVTMADLRAIAAAQRTRWVHPAQIYDAVGLTLMFFVLSAILHRRRRHGMVIAWTMLLYPVSRFVQEILRGDNPHDVAGLTISQFLSLVLFGLGLVYMFVLIRLLPERSRRSSVQSPSRR